jgi:hypothetical protein
MVWLHKSVVSTHEWFALWIQDWRSPPTFFWPRPVIFVQEVTVVAVAIPWHSQEGGRRRHAAHSEVAALLSE